MSKYIVIVKDEYVRKTEVYNGCGLVGEREAWWQYAVLPLWVGIYKASSRAAAINAAAADCGIVPEALTTVE